MKWRGCLGHCQTGYSYSSTLYHTVSTSSSFRLHYIAAKGIYRRRRAKWRRPPLSSSLDFAPWTAQAIVHRLVTSLASLVADRWWDKKAPPFSTDHRSIKEEDSDMFKSLLLAPDVACCIASHIARRSHHDETFYIDASTFFLPFCPLFFFLSLSFYFKTARELSSATVPAIRSLTQRRIHLVPWWT